MIREMTDMLGWALSFGLALAVAITPTILIIKFLSWLEERKIIRKLP